MGRPLINLTGHRFGRWTVLAGEEQMRGKKRYWPCKCDCGTQRWIESGSLRSGRSISCGCRTSERMQSMRIELAGKRFGSWTVIELAPERDERHKRWICSCDCGTVREVLGYSLRHGTSLSCGCMAAEIISKKMDQGLGTARRWSAEEKAFWSMRSRCSPHNAEMFPHYYGRGIRICESWSSFENFIADMGKIPQPGYTLDRIDNDGPYSPENCRWADKTVQANNRRPRPG